MSPIAVDLFAGAGGLSLGLEQAGYEIAAAVEFDPTHAATHEFNFPKCTTFCRDISSLTGNEIRSESSIGDREVHLVAGGPPCQGISLMGKRSLNDPRNALMAEFARIVIELEPRYFLMENVAGLAIGDHTALLDEVIELLEQSGYQIQLPYQVLQAADFGTPQSRRRLILIGSRADVPLPEYPMPSYRPRAIRGQESRKTDDDLLEIGPSVFDAIGDLPDVDGFDQLRHSDSIQTDLGQPSPYAAILRGLVRDKEDFSQPRRWDSTILTSSARTLHTEKSIKRFAATLPGTNESVSRFLRLHPEGISNTLRAGTASDRGAHTAPRPIHPFLPRVITVREAARLHGYPDWFRFHATKWSGFRQIGNSVPPLLGRAVGAEFLRADGITPKRRRPINLGDSSLLYLTPTEAQKYFQIDYRVIPQRRRVS